MRSKQAGFTLIELVMVIVLIGILAAVAIPKFVDLSDEARAAALSGVAGGMTSASSVNYAARKAAPTKGTAVNNCDDIAALLQGGVLPTGYTVASSAVAVDATKDDCVVTQTDSGNTANFSITGIN